MKIIVNPKNYTNYEYSPYLKRGNPVEAPANPNYVVGQVVVIPNENHKDPSKNFVLAVVLGCIDEEFDGELRTDVHGMVCIDKIRPAVVTDFGKSNVTYIPRLYKECQGEAVVIIHEHKILGEDRQESLWFHGKHIATVRKDDKTFIVEATGEQRIFIDLNGGANFEDSPRLDGEEATKACIKFGMFDQDLQNEDKVHFEMNSWFAIRELDAEGNATDDVAICHTYDEAIQLATDEMNNPTPNFIVQEK